MRKAMAKSGGTLDDSLLGDIHEAISDKVPPNQLLQFLIIIKRTFVKRYDGTDTMHCLYCETTGQSGHVLQCNNVKTDISRHHSIS